MTKVSKQLLIKAGILPKLRLGLKIQGGGVKPTGAHRVKIIEDKVIMKSDMRTGRKVEYVRYTVEEDGERKVYDTKMRGEDGQLSYLVQRFAELNEGEEIILEMKKQGAKNYIEVTPTTHSASIEVDDDDSVDTAEYFEQEELSNKVDKIYEQE